MARSGTRTSDFGVSKRESHDASKFYESKLYEGISIDEDQHVVDKSNEIKGDLINQILQFNLENLSKIPDSSIHLMIYAIPSIAGQKNIQIDSFIKKIEQNISLIKPKLINGGRLIVMVDNQVDSSISISRFYPLHAYIVPYILDQGLFMRGEIILSCPKNKELNENSTEVTSNRKSFLEKSYSHAMVFSYKNSKRIKYDINQQIDKKDSITRDQFLEYTKSVWFMGNEESIGDKNREYLGYISRFIHLYSFEGDFCLFITSVGWCDIVEIKNSISNLKRKNIFLLVK